MGREDDGPSREMNLPGQIDRRIQGVSKQFREKFDDIVERMLLVIENNDVERR